MINKGEKLLLSSKKYILMKARLVELMAAMAFVPPNLVTSMYRREKGGEEMKEEVRY